MNKLLTIGLVSVIGFALTSVISFAQTCELTPGLLAFGTLNPNEISTSDATLTLTNSGTSDISSLSISGSDWDTASGFDVSQTHYSLLADQPYSSMSLLSSSPQTLGISLFPATLYFKLHIPIHQAHADYQQTITFTFDCPEQTITTTTTISETTTTTETTTTMVETTTTI
jgi:hypothetical protein